MVAPVAEMSSVPAQTHTPTEKGVVLRNRSAEQYSSPCLWPADGLGQVLLFLPFQLHPGIGALLC